MARFETAFGEKAYLGVIRNKDHMSAVSVFFHDLVHHGFSDSSFLVLAMDEDIMEVNSMYAVRKCIDQAN